MDEQKNMLPEGISIESEGPVQIIHYEWYSNFYIPIIIFFALWDLFLIGYFIQELGRHANILELVVVSAPQTLIGAVMSYFSIAIIVNETIIELGNSELKVTHTPLPWRGNRTINVCDIQSVECERGGGSRHSPSIDIVLYFKNGGRRTLLSMIQNRETADFIKKQVREFINNPLHSAQIKII